MNILPFSKIRSVHGDHFFLAGQVGLKDGQLVTDNIQDQTEQVIKNLEAILAEAGLSLKNVVDVTAFLINEDDYTLFNEVYSRHFEQPYPTRTTIAVKWLPLGARVELKVIAFKSE